MGLTLQGLPSGPMTIPDGNLGAGEAAVSSGIVRVKRMRMRELRLSRVNNIQFARSDSRLRTERTGRTYYDLIKTTTRLERTTKRLLHTHRK